MNPLLSTRPKAFEMSRINILFFWNLKNFSFSSPPIRITNGPSEDASSAFSLFQYPLKDRRNLIFMVFKAFKNVSAVVNQLRKICLFF